MNSARYNARYCVIQTYDAVFQASEQTYLSSLVYILDVAKTRHGAAVSEALGQPWEPGHIGHVELVGRVTATPPALASFRAGAWVAVSARRRGSSRRFWSGFGTGILVLISRRVPRRNWQAFKLGYVKGARE